MAQEVLQIDDGLPVDASPDEKPAETSLEATLAQLDASLAG